MKYDLVIFDCDGTLVDSESLTCVLISEMFRELGMTVSSEECFSMFVGKSMLDISTYLIKHLGSEFDTSAFENDYRNRCLAIFDNRLLPISGVETILTQLKVPFCVASNGPLAKMERTLPAAGLTKYFSEDRIFSAYEINSWKPEPGLFLYATEKMKCHPSRALVIEDTIPGIMGAINAGIDVWAYNPHSAKELCVEGVFNFASMVEIQEQLRLLALV